MCARFLFVQPGVVSTCSVTERISFVNSFAAFFKERRFWSSFGFLSCWTIFEPSFPKICGVVIAGFLDRVWCAIFSRTSRLRFFHFYSIFDFAHQR